MRLISYIALLFALSVAHVSAGEEEERKALKALLPTLIEAWNSGKPEAYLALYPLDHPMVKRLTTDPKVKAEFEEGYPAILAEFGKITATEIRGYIARKSRFVVRVTYEKKGVVAGTFAVAQDDDGTWYLDDFNIDGQNEPELKK